MPQKKPITYIHLETVNSTNTWVKEHHTSLNSQEFTCLYASEQTAGRGRFNRKWLSAKGNNIYATLYFCVEKNFTHLGNLSQILSLACIEVLEQKGFHPQIKWPNDILVEGKKLAGILCETITVNDQIGVVLGIGINVDLSPSLLATIDQPATSLAQLSEKSWKQEQLLEPLVELFLKHLDVLQKEGFSPFVPLYTERLTLKDKWITHHNGAQILEGRYESINDRGEFVLRLPNGKLVTLFSGEITQKL